MSLASEMKTLAKERKAEIKRKEREEQERLKKEKRENLEKKVGPLYNALAKELPDKIKAEADLGRTTLLLIESKWGGFGAEEKFLMSMLMNWAWSNGFTPQHRSYPESLDNPGSESFYIEWS